MPSAASTTLPPSRSEGSSLTESDAALLQPAAEGCPEAFSTLFNRHYGNIHAFAYRLCLCGAEAEDIAQETFIQAARALGSFRGQASFKNWLYAIATNRARDRLRQRQRRERLDTALQAEAMPAGMASRPDAAHDRHDEIRAALGALPLAHREVINLVFYENLNHAEAARVLGCAESTVSWRLFRAKSKLRKLLGSHD